MLHISFPKLTRGRAEQMFSYYLCHRETARLHPKRRSRRSIRHSRRWHMAARVDRRKFACERPALTAEATNVAHLLPQIDPRPRGANVLVLFVPSRNGTTSPKTPKSPLDST